MGLSRLGLELELGLYVTHQANSTQSTAKTGKKKKKMEVLRLAMNGVCFYAWVTPGVWVGVRTSAMAGVRARARAGVNWGYCW